MLKLLLYLLCALPVLCVGQHLTGQITDEKGAPVVGATVRLVNEDKGTISDIEGLFTFGKMPKGDYLLSVSFIGFQEQTISVSHQQGSPVRISLKEDVEELRAVVVNADRETAHIKTSGYSVNVIDPEGFKDLNVDANRMLSMSSGVVLRQTGGLGSSFSLSLNGLSGNQVRYFMDGVSMEYFGSAMTLNNLPANLIRSIEVYKGVVPIKFPIDALGGCININTAKPTERFVDASYSFGSFNTHQASIVGQTNVSEKIFFKVWSFYNHADNNYKMYDMPASDAFGNITGTQNKRRFHDDYTSGSIMIETGLLNQRWADRLSVGLVYGANNNNIQHPEVSINRVYGGLNRKTQDYQATIKYDKSLEQIRIMGNVFIAKTDDITYDTLSRLYDWSGGYKDLSVSNAGEFFGQKSIFNITDNKVQANWQAYWNPHPNHELSASYYGSYLYRKGWDDINPNNLSFRIPNRMGKQVGGVAYSFTSKANKIRVSVFSKVYGYQAKINTEEYVDGANQQAETKASFERLGYGWVSSYTPSPQWRLKMSFERAYRLPEPEETMGDGLFGLPNPELRDENTYNFNLEAAYNQQIGNGHVTVESNVFYRPVKDNIFYINDQGIYGSYYNISYVRVIGLETSARLKTTKGWKAVFNCTYQSLTDQNKWDEGLINANYGERVPNTPYLFGYANLGYDFYPKDRNKASISWSTQYVHEFFLYWANLGYKSDKNKIPTQFTNNLTCSYTLQDGRYSISAEARNIFNALAYDNYRIQKPGRAMYLKFRYFLNQ